MHVEPPFVVVGHGLGCLYADHFARQYASQIQGAVFVDPVAPRGVWGPDCPADIVEEFVCPTERQLWRKQILAFMGVYLCACTK